MAITNISVYVATSVSAMNLLEISCVNKLTYYIVMLYDL